MTQFLDEFVDRVDGAAITDAFTSRWVSAGGTVQYHNRRGWIHPAGAAFASEDDSADGRYFYSFDAAGSVDDAEVLVLVHAGILSSTITGPGVCLRGTGSAGSESGYLVHFTNQGSQNGLVIRLFNGGTSILAAENISPFPIDEDRYYWLRAEVVGTTIRGKYWALGEDEPGSWNLETTDGTLSNGRVGLWTFESSNAAMYWASLRIGTEGDSPPENPVAPQGPRVKQGGDSNLVVESAHDPGMEAYHPTSSGHPTPHIRSESYAGVQSGVSDWDASQFRIRTTSGPGAWTTSAVVSVGTLATGGHPKASFSGLSSETEYDLAERRRNSAGEWSQWSLPTLAVTTAKTGQSIFVENFRPPETDLSSNPPPRWEWTPGTTAEVIALDGLFSFSVTEDGSGRGSFLPTGVGDPADAGDDQRVRVLVDMEAAAYPQPGINLQDDDSGGYYLDFRIGGTATLYRWNGGASRTSLDSIAVGAVPGPSDGRFLFVEVRRDGTEVQARWWDPADPSGPPAWGTGGAQDLEATDTTFDGGLPGFTRFDGLSVGGQTWRCMSVEVEAENITITPPDTPTVSVSFEGPDYVVVSSSAFGPHVDEPSDTHLDSQWQVTTAADTSFASPLVDILASASGADDVNLLDAILGEGTLSVDTDYLVRVRHFGTIGGASAWSTAAAFRTQDVDQPTTPTLEVVETGTDYVKLRLSAFAHPDNPLAGRTLLTSRFQVTSDGGSFTPPTVADTGELAIADEETVTLFGLSPGTAYDTRGRHTDDTGAPSEYSATVDFTTDSAPANAPNEPNVFVTEETQVGATYTGTAYSHPLGDAHKATQFRTDGSRLIELGPVIEYVDGGLAPGIEDITVEVRYQDENDNWGPWSDPATYSTLPEVPCPEITNPSPGETFAADFVFQWTALDPVEWPAIVYDGEWSDDNGVSWTSLFTNEVGTSYPFPIVGLGNGNQYALRVRARAASDDYTPELVSEWCEVTFAIDRTGGRTTVLDLTTIDVSTLPVLWDSYRTTWGGGSGSPITASTGEPDEFCPAGHAAGPSVLAFPQFGEPTEVDITVVMSFHPTFATPWYWLYNSGLRGGAAAIIDETLAPWNSFGHPCGAPDDPIGPPGITGFATRLHLGTMRNLAGDACPTVYPQIYIDQARGLGVWGEGLAIGNTVNLLTWGRGRRLSDGVALSRFPSANRNANPAGKGRIVSKCDLIVRKYTVRFRVTTAPGGAKRVRAMAYGPGVPMSGWQYDETTTVNTLDTPCGLCGLVFSEVIGIESQGPNLSAMQFHTMTVTPISYDGCAPPPAGAGPGGGGALLGCEADWDFTVFEDDDLTPWYGSADSEGNVVEADFYTDRSCPRPYLLEPKDFSDTEIDFPAGASTIGAIRVGVVDKRLVSTDQDTGIVTAKIADAAGRRAVLRRWREDLGMVTVFDGVIHKHTVSRGDVVTHWFQVRDPRDRERGTRLFDRNETFSMWPAPFGPADGYGTRLDGGKWISPAPVEDATFELASDPSPADGIYYGFVPIEPIEEPILSRESGLVLEFGPLELFQYPTPETGTGLWRYEDATIRWRPDGGGEEDWTYLRRMPRAVGAGLTSRATQTGLSAGGKIFAARTGLYFGSLDPADLPSDSEEIEFQVLAVRTTEETPFFWDQGTFGDLLLEIYEGQHTDGAPRIRFSEPALTLFAAETPETRLVMTEPVDDMREWVQENIFAPLGYAPSFDADMRIEPEKWELPAADDDLLVLDVDWIIPEGDFEHGTDSFVNHVTFKYLREFVVFEAEPNPDGGYAWEDYRTREIQRSYIFAPSLAIASGEITYEPETVRSYGDTLGGPVGGDAQKELGARLGDKLSDLIFNRFGFGAAEWAGEVRSGMAHGPTFDPYTLDLQIGQWVIASIPWEPNYGSGTRGLLRVMQIVHLGDPDIAHRSIVLQDGGPADCTDLAPTLGYLSTEEDTRVLVPVDEFPPDAPEGYKGRVDYAISPTEPAASSGLWTFLGRAEEPGVVLVTEDLPSGSSVWVRARGESPGCRPSAWTAAQFVLLGDAPVLSSVVCSIEGTLPVVQWTANEFTGGVRVEYEITLIGVEPSTFSFIRDRAVGDTPYQLFPLSVDEGQAIHIKVTPFEGFDGVAVTGDAGIPWVVTCEHEDPDAPDLTDAVAFVSDEGSCAYVQDLVISVNWEVTGTTTGYTVSIDRSTDSGAWVAVASGLSPGVETWDDVIGSVEVDPAGVRTERRYRVRLVRSADSVTVDTETTGTVTTYETDCAS